MFSRVAKGGFQKIARRLSSDSSNSEFEAWNAAYKNMRNEAKEIAESAVGGIKSEVSSLRSEMRIEIASVKSDVHALKSDVHGLIQGQVEIHKQINDVHKQMSNNTRTILVTIVGVAGVFFAANRYFDDKNGNKVTPKI